MPKDGNLVGDNPPVVKMSLLSRIFVWSIIFEPLLFFILFERTISGVTSNLGRILQIVVVIGLVLKLLSRCLTSKSADVRLVNFSNPLLYINYGIYFFLAMFAGFIGLLSGAYDLPTAYEQSNDVSGFSLFLNSQAIRPVFEYVVTLYYFVYFAILPQYLLKTEISVEYFFSVFKTVFIISFVIGVIDFAFSAVGISLVPRHIADWRTVGVRFHGLAGEPRDAFVYLFLGLAILHLQAHFKGLILSKWWVVAIIAAALLTQSASGLLGIMFFLGLISLYSLGRMSIQGFVRLFFLLTLTIAFVYVAAVNSDRIMEYLESASYLWSILETGGEIPYLMSVQMSSIYPLYDLTVKFRDFNILPIFIGSGLGSASVINNIFNATAEMNNPTSQFVRVVFETGLIGAYFFIMSFAYPVTYLTKHLPANKRRGFILLTLLLLGCFLAHRSAASFIYLGIFIAAFRVLDPKPVLNVSFPQILKENERQNI